MKKKVVKKKVVIKPKKKTTPAKKSTTVTFKGAHGKTVKAKSNHAYDVRVAKKKATGKYK